MNLQLLRFGQKGSVIFPAFKQGRKIIKIMFPENKNNQVFEKADL